MIVKYFLVILCIFIVDTNAGTIDCKTIDLEKFKELFNFKYSGGSVGLRFDFDFIGTTSSFKIQDCKFEIVSNYANGKKQPAKNKLNGLQGCTKYNIKLLIKNVASKKSFNYENFVTTKPDQKSKIEVKADEMRENSADLSYTSASTECMTKIIAILKDRKKNEIKNMTLSQKIFTFDDLTSSKSYVVQIVASDDKGNKVLSNELKIRTKSSEMDNEIDDIDVTLKISNVKTNNAQLKWDLNDADVDEDLKIVYLLEVINSDGKLALNATYTNNSVNIQNLEACTEYTAKVTIIGATKSSNITFTTEKSPPSGATNLNYYANHTISMISWNHPDKNPNCVLDYTVRYHYEKERNDTKSYQQTIVRNQTSLSINRLPYSKKIYIHVYANYDTSNNATRSIKSAEFENFNVDEFAVTTIRESRLSATEVNFVWSFDTSYKDTDVLDYFEVDFDGQTLKTKVQSIHLVVQACKKNYTISIRCVSKSGNVGPNVTYDTKFNDKEVVLSAINTTNIEVHKNNEALSFVWKPSVYEASCIAYYEIEFAEDVFKTREPKMVISKSESCMLYQIFITPISESGTRGHTTFFEYETDILVPLKPAKPSLVYAGNRELKISSSISDSDKRCVDMTPTFIEFTCNNVVVEELISRSQSQYTVKILDLHPNTKYECITKVRNSNGTSDKSDPSVFETLQDSPQPPDEIRTQVSDNSVTVKWRANNSTGYADYYHVHVTFVKFLYNFGKNCDKKIRNTTVIESVEPFVNISKLLPFSQYKIKIRASNLYGKSDFSKEAIFNTNPSSPTEPRNVTVQFKIHDNSTVSAFLSWMSPCKMNGKFSLYTITVNGQRKGVENDKRTEASALEEIELHDLSHEFNYDIEIQAVNQKDGSARIFGKIAKFSFVTPSGIPLEDDLKNWTLLGTNPDKADPKNVEVYLKQRMLVSKVGNITGIAFLIFLANCADLPQPTFGYLSSTNISLPSAQENMECSEVYQQTEFLENPLSYDNEMEMGDLDNYTVKFVIGEDECYDDYRKVNFCNGELKCVNCTYGLMARVFTSNGFRDTEPVFFEIKSNSILLHLSSTSLIIGGSVLLLLLVSFTIFLICCMSYRRKQKKMKKKKEAAEPVENLLSFTSYCVIDKNPTPKNQFDHLL